MRIKVYRISLLIVLIGIIIITGIIAFTYISQNKIDYDKKAIPADEFMYLLKEHEQKIGVYRTDETSPFMTIDVYVSTLPAVDQQELKSGVMIQNDDKLKTIIEDYES